MSQQQLINILELAWIVFGVYWLMAARKAKAARTRESPAYRMFRLLILAATFTLLFAEWTGIGFLGRHFFSPMLLAYTGFAAAIAGMTLAIWARIALGQYWSDKVVLKFDHQLVRDGPYARMRHPIYSGVLLGVAGTALLVDEWRAVLAFLVLLVNYAVKAKREDSILAGAFPREFAEHKRGAGFLFPRIFTKK